MSDTAPPSARDVAVNALGDRAGNVTARLDRLLAGASLSPADKGFAHELVMGVLRRRLTLQTVLRAFLERPDRKLPTPLERVLLVAAYQLIFLDRVPDFAAVNEAVEQAVRFGHRRQSGLVNGLLRGVSRSLSELVPTAAPPAGDVIRISPGSHKRIGRAVFADPAKRPAEHLSEAFSLPLSLAERWLARQGDLEAAAELAMHANARPPLILRVNRMRASVQDVLDSLTADGVQARPHANGLSVALMERCELTALAAFGQGWVQAQDPTASAVSIAAAPRPGMRVLDFCAAPGTKTTHLAELMDNQGLVTAIDVSQLKLERVTSNCARLGISIVETALATEIGRLSPASYDLALVDAPCSNTGVLARRPEARWRFDPAALAGLAGDQLLLVKAAAAFVKPGGRLVYSTCCIEPEECSDVAQAASRRIGLRRIDQKLALPTGTDTPEAWADGGYWAVFAIGRT